MAEKNPDDKTVQRVDAKVQQSSARREARYSATTDRTTRAITTRESFVRARAIARG